MNHQKENENLKWKIITTHKSISQYLENIYKYESNGLKLVLTKYATT